MHAQTEPSFHQILKSHIQYREVYSGFPRVLGMIYYSPLLGPFCGGFEDYGAESVTGSV